MSTVNESCTIKHYGLVIYGKLTGNKIVSVPFTGLDKHTYLKKHASLL